jgi:Uma2 family endonuclease
MAIAKTASGLHQTGARVHPEAAPVARYKFTPEAFHQLGALGFFDDCQRYELIEGDIYAMPPIGPEHSVCVEVSSRLFHRQEKRGQFHACVQNPLRLGDSELVPDIAIVAGNPEDYRAQHPTSALLVIEIADTTLEFDRTHRLPLYARAGIAEFWIVNLQERVLEVYREPSGTRYKSLRVFMPDEVVNPLFAPEGQIPVAALFG